MMNKYIALLLLTLTGACGCLYGMDKQKKIKKLKEPAYVIRDQLRTAVVKGDIDTIKNLHDQGWDISLDNGKSSYLIVAVNNLLYPVITKGTVEDLMKILRDKESDLKLVDWGANSLIAAAEKGKGRMVKLLLEAGALPNGSTMMTESAIHFAAQFNPFKFYPEGWNDLDPLDVLIASGADVNFLSKNYKPPLFFAIKGGYIPHIQKIIEAGANIYDTLNDYKDIINYSVLEALAQKSPDIYSAVIFTVSSKEMDNLVATLLMLSRHKGLSLNKDVRNIIIKKVYNALLEDKIALAKKYNPEVTQYQIGVGKNMLRESFNRALKNPIIQRKIQEVIHVKALPGNSEVESMDVND